jgi:hypothetical protein
MTWARHASPPQHEHGQFAKARALAKIDNNIQRGRAVRTVAGHSLDAQDCSNLLSMLGLATDGGELETTSDR